MELFGSYLVNVVAMTYAKESVLLVYKVEHLLGNRQFHHAILGEVGLGCSWQFGSPHGCQLHLMVFGRWLQCVVDKKFGAGTETCELLFGDEVECFVGIAVGKIP